MTIDTFLTRKCQHVSIRPTGYQTTPARRLPTTSAVRVAATPIFSFIFLIFNMYHLNLPNGPNLVGDGPLVKSRLGYPLRLLLLLNEIVVPVLYVA